MLKRVDQIRNYLITCDINFTEEEAGCFILKGVFGPIHLDTTTPGAYVEIRSRDLTNIFSMIEGIGGSCR